MLVLFAIIFDWKEKCLKSCNKFEIGIRNIYAIWITKNKYICYFSKDISIRYVIKYTRLMIMRKNFKNFYSHNGKLFCNTLLFTLIDLITYSYMYTIHRNGIPECVKNNHNGRCIFKENYVNGLFLFLMNDANKNIKNCILNTLSDIQLFLLYLCSYKYLMFV